MNQFNPPEPISTKYCSLEIHSSLSLLILFLVVLICAITATYHHYYLLMLLVVPPQLLVGSSCSEYCVMLQGVPYPFPYFPQQLPMHMSAPLPIGQASPQPGGLLSSANPLSHSIPLGQQQQQPSHQQHNKPPTSLDKQIVNETIRRRISDKMLAQQVSDIKVYFNSF